MFRISWQDTNAPVVAGTFPSQSAAETAAKALLPTRAGSRIVVSERTEVLGQTIWVPRGTVT